MRTERWLLACLLALAGCASGQESVRECVPVVGENGERSGRCLPVAPADRRVDTGVPVFSKPAEVTNPLHPTATVAQTIYGGQVGGEPFHTEVTLLPEKKTVRGVEVVTVQYFALSGGRITEVALDWYAQADDGAVWYLGEDVFNYEDGVVADTDGTWVAGPRSPAAMIMPARPVVGAVYRPENAPGVVFEEVTVTAVDETVPGPSGPVHGAITVEELHMDGTREAKTFAPGYGEFSTGNADGDLEAASLALPTDAAGTPLPSTMDALATAIRRTTDALAAGDWATATTAAGELGSAWTAARPDVPLELLGKQMDRDIRTLTGAITARDADAARHAGLRVHQNVRDLRSRHQPVPVTDQERFGLWAYQVVVDAAAGDRGAVQGDHACLMWMFDRIRHTMPDPSTVDHTLDTLGAAAERGDLAAASAYAHTLGW